LWTYLNIAAIDLDNFLVCLFDQVCPDAPPYSSFSDPENLQAAAQDLRKQLKSATVSLEYLGEPPLETITAKVDPLEFGFAVRDEAGNLIDFEPVDQPQVRFGMAQEEEGELMDENLVRADPNQNNELFLRFNYEDMSDGQLLVVKTYKEGQESTGLRLVETWNLGQQGLAAFRLTPGRQFALAPGEYYVELYVEGNLIQEGRFTISSTP